MATSPKGGKGKEDKIPKGWAHLAPAERWTPEQKEEWQAQAVRKAAAPSGGAGKEHVPAHDVPTRGNPGGLVAAVRDGDFLEVKRIMRGMGDRVIGDVNQMDQFGNTALHWAVSADQIDLLHMLLKMGARVNVVNEEDQSPLMRACRMGRDECVDALLDAGAQAGGSDRDGGTALMKAARSGHLRIIEKLLECGAQHAVFDRHKMSALHHAARHGHAEAIRVLVRVGSKIDERDDRDWTPLMHAADQGHGKATAMLLEMGADVLAQTDTNNTALDFAWDHETRLALRLSAKRARIAEAEAVAAAEADAVAKMQREYEENEAAEAAVREALKSEGFIDKLKDSFNKFDMDGSGSICIAEFGHACQAIGKVFANEDELQETMGRFDMSGDGDISFNEFLDWWKEDAKEEFKRKARDSDPTNDDPKMLETSVGQQLKEHEEIGHDLAQ